MRLRRAAEPGALFDAIKARGAAPGRRAIDPRILFALWLYAALDGVGRGREVARLTREHDAYRWICGGVPVNYHALNDFRSGGGLGCDKALDEVLSDNVAALSAVGRSRRSVWRRTACACVPTPGRPHSAVRRAWKNTGPRHASWCKR